MAEPAPRPLPTFLIIGAQKSATRWLRFNLGRHPEICTAPRELEFFNTDAFEQLGLGHYASLFENWEGEKVVGEATPGYMMHRENPAEIAKRIDESLPGVRLIALLRNPVDRIESALLHHAQRGRLPLDRPRLSYLARTAPTQDPWGIVTGSWYAASLRPYVRRFGGRLLVLLHDDAVATPGEVYRRACAHVGAAADFKPKALDRMRFSNRDAGEASPEAAEPFSDGERAVAMGYVRNEIDELERMLDIDLSRWRLGARFSGEVKKGALERMLGDEAAPEVVAREMDVPLAMLARWRDQAVAQVAEQS
jgi:hypothetical protein